MDYVSVEGADIVIKDFTAVGGRIGVAQVRAMNRSLTAGKTLVARLIAADMGIAVGSVKKVLTAKPATFPSPVARLGASLKRLPLYAFGGKQTRQGWVSRFKGGVGRYPHAFVATMPTGHVGVFERVGKKRLPIYEVPAISIGHVFDKFRKETTERMLEAFETNFDHELERALTMQGAFGLSQSGVEEFEQALEGAGA